MDDRHGQKKAVRAQLILFVSGCTAIAVMTSLAIWVAVRGQSSDPRRIVEAPCNPYRCSLSLVESIPENLTYISGSPKHASIYTTWKQLLSRANESIDIASSYWSLRNQDTKTNESSAYQGEDIFAELMKAGTERGIKIRIAQSKPNKYQPDQDTIDLVKAGAAEVRSLDFPRWFNAGILHTKMWLVDRKHFYVGNANLDWRSLTQVKEMGVAAMDCSCLARDMAKIFDVYWAMGGSTSTSPPQSWPVSTHTTSNLDTPMHLQADSKTTDVYLASSPPGLCPKGRSSDIDAILNVMQNAQQFIYVAVMDYFPLTIYTHPQKFWPVIDDALKAAALNRRIEVRVMASWWSHSRKSLNNFLASLGNLDGVNGANVKVKLFEVPSFTEDQKRIPYARVNHNKYMVTDKQAYIGTSNWSGDYFISTGGIGFVANQSQTNLDTMTLQRQLVDVFNRDWNSEYARDVKLHD